MINKPFPHIQLAITIQNAVQRGTQGRTYVQGG